MNRVRLLHVTEFAYDTPVSESYNEVHLQPLDDDRQHCLAFKLRTHPTSMPSVSKDYFGNAVHRFNVLPRHRRLRVEAESVVMVEPPPSPDDDAGLRLSALPGRRDALLDQHWDWLVPSTYTPAVPGLGPLVHAAEEQSGGTVLGFARAACDVVHGRFRYAKGATHVRSSVDDVLEAGAGVCQDFAHILIAVLRVRGVPARYVSGYLVPPKTRPADTSIEEVIGGQASHAWVEALVPDVGWVALDPTLGRPVGAQHVRVGYGRDYGDVAPVRGIYRGHAGQRLSVDVRMRPALDGEGHELLHEHPVPPNGEPAAEEPLQQQQQQQQ
jgi:transglutaminase-like putative cysteine protease